MYSNVVLGQYLPGNSLIHRLDPRLKIGLLMLMLVTVFFPCGFWGYLLIFAYLCVAQTLSGISVKRVISAIKPMLVMLVFLLIFNVLLIRTGRVVATLGPVTVYSGGLYQSLYIAVRLVLIVMMTTLLTATTKPLDMTLGLEHLLSPLRKIGFPTYEVAMMISIALRFIPTLLEETQRIMKAQASRGVDFNEGTFREKVTSVISLIIPLFISAFQRADDLANAMESRNYNPHAKRTRYHQLRWQGYDTAALLISLLVSGIAIAMSFVL